LHIDEQEHIGHSIYKPALPVVKNEELNSDFHQRERERERERERGAYKKDQ